MADARAPSTMLSCALSLIVVVSHLYGRGRLQRSKSGASYITTESSSIDGNCIFRQAGTTINHRQAPFQVLDPSIARHADMEVDLATPRPLGQVDIVDCPAPIRHSLRKGPRKSPRAVNSKTCTQNEKEKALRPHHWR